jgi:hypothetical protein
MKKIHFLFAAFLCISVNAQNMYIRPITGSQSIYPVADIQKLAFENGNILVTNNGGNSVTFALSGLRYVSFTDFNLGTTVPELATNRLYAYPNPASQLINILGSNNMQHASHIQIVSLEGRLLMEQKAANTTTVQVDISALPQGMYLCKITDGNQKETIKFLKQ